MFASFLTQQLAYHPGGVLILSLIYAVVVLSLHNMVQVTAVSGAQFLDVTFKNLTGQVADQLSFLKGGSAGYPMFTKDGAPGGSLSGLTPGEITDGLAGQHSGTEIKKQASGLDITGYDVESKNWTGIGDVGEDHSVQHHKSWLFKTLHMSHSKLLTEPSVIDPTKVLSFNLAEIAAGGGDDVFKSQCCLFDQLSEIAHC